MNVQVKTTANALDGKRIVIHGDKNWLLDFSPENHPFFAKLHQYFRMQNVAVSAVDAQSQKVKNDLNDPCAFHILVNQPPSYGPRQLHLSHSPIIGFWHLDELGQGAHSSRRLIEFSPQLINRNKATYFFNGVSSFMIRENMSTYTQAPRVDAKIESAFAVVFCQSNEEMSISPYLSHLDMIETTANFNKQAKIYVRCHPDLSKAEQRQIKDKCQSIDNAILSKASIHDLIDASEIVVTQNCAHGFEAIMHKCPIITCAKSSYWHATLTAKSKVDLEHALSYATKAMHDFAWEEYFYWSLTRHGFEAAKDNFVQRVISRIVDKALW